MSSSDQFKSFHQLLNLISLEPTLYLDNDNIGLTDNKRFRISLVIDKIKIIDNIFLLTEAVNINEIKPTLNTEASKELQLF